MSHPTISAIIPVYNDEKHLAEAIESVLAQTLPASEIIVVDDGSTDGSVAIAESFAGVNCLRCSHGGEATTRNAGIAASQGEFIAFLDSDDIWTADKLEKQLAFFLEKSGEGGSGQDSTLNGLCFTQQRFLLLPDEPEPNWIKPHLLHAQHDGLIPSSLMFHRETGNKVGEFSAQVGFGCDYDWFMRARQLGLPFHVVPELLLWKRVHQTNMSAVSPAEDSAMMRVLRLSLQRRRAQ